MAESSPEGWVLSDEALQKVIKTVRRELGRPVNQRDDRGRAPGFSGRLVYPFINDSESTAPRGAVLGVTASLKISLNEDAVFSVVYRCTQANTTFRNHWGVNVGGPVAAGECGLCTFEGPVNIAYDSGTPAFGEGWGPKPGQWTLSKGYPATTLVDGIVDSTNKLLLGTLAPITTLLCKAVGAQTVGTISTGDYKIWSGGVTGGADSGFTTLPDVYIQADLSDGDFFLAHWVDGKWVSPKGGGKGKTWHALAAADIAAGASGNVTLPDTSIGASGVVSATNWSDDVDIDNGDKIEVWQDAYDDLYYAHKGSGAAGEEITVVTDVRYNSTNHRLEKKTRVVKVIDPAAESAWTTVHQLVSEEFATNLFWSEHTLTWLRQVGWVFELEEGTEADPIEFSLRTFVVDVYDGTTYLKQDKIDGYVVDPSDTPTDVGGGAASNIIPIEECEE